jgi:F-type H+-transporting ATPase subunit epsilon
MAKISCIVVTPEATVLEEVVEFVALPLYDGEIGISPNHSPMIGRLGYGELRLRNGADVRRYYVDGGFVQVDENVVSVLTGRATPAGQLDTAAAQQQLKQAIEEVAATDDLQEIRERRILQARAQIRIGGRA